MSLTASELRANIYRLLDQVIETGEPLEIRRKGRVIRLVADPLPIDFDALPAHPDAVAGDPGDLPEVSWEAEWTPDP